MKFISEIRIASRQPTGQNGGPEAAVNEGESEREQQREREREREWLRGMMRDDKDD